MWAITFVWKNFANEMFDNHEKNQLLSADYGVKIYVVIITKKAILFKF